MSDRTIYFAILGFFLLLLSSAARADAEFFSCSADCLSEQSSDDIECGALTLDDSQAGLRCYNQSRKDMNQCIRQCQDEANDRRAEERDY